MVDALTSWNTSRMTAEGEARRSKQRAARDLSSPQALAQSSNPVLAAAGAKALAQAAAADDAAQEQAAKSAVVAPQGAGQMSREAFGNALGLADQLDAGRKAVKVDNRMYGSRKKFIDRQKAINEPEAREEVVTETVTDPLTGETTEVPLTETKTVIGEDGTPQFVERPVTRTVVESEREKVEKGVLSAEQQSAERVAQFRREQEAKMATEEQLLQQREDDRMDRMERQRVERDRVNGLVRTAAEKLAAQPDVDPNREWRDRPAGMKFLAGLTALVGGFGGSTATMDAIQSSIERDIDAQKANIGKRIDELGAAERVSAEAGNVYEQFRQDLGDERLADLSYEQARLQSAEAQFQRILAENGVQQLDAEQQKFLVDLKERQNQVRLQLDEAAVANVPFTTRVVQTIGPNKAALLKRAANEQVDLSADLTREDASQQGKMQVERLKQAAEAAGSEDKLARGEGGYLKEAQHFAQANAPWLDVVNQIDMINAEYGSDKPGVGPFAFTESITDRARKGKFDAAIGQLREAIGRARSQGAITDDEEARFLDSIEEGTMFGGEERYQTNLDALRTAFQSRVDPGFRALSKEAQQHLTNNALIPESDAKHYGLAPQRDVVQRK